MRAARLDKRPDRPLWPPTVRVQKARAAHHEREDGKNRQVRYCVDACNRCD
jgi:hypothetical protein